MYIFILHFSDMANKRLPYKGKKRKNYGNLAKANEAKK